MWIVGLGGFFVDAPLCTNFKVKHLQNIRKSGCSCFYFCSRTTDVMESNGWKTLVRDHPHLIDQVFKAFLASTQTPLIGPPRKRQKTS